MKTKNFIIIFFLMTTLLPEEKLNITSHNYHYDVFSAVDSGIRSTASIIDLIGRSRYDHNMSDIYFEEIENPTDEILAQLKITIKPSSEYIIGRIIATENPSIGKDDIFLADRKTLKIAPSILKINNITYQSNKTKYIIKKYSIINIYQCPETKTFKLWRTGRLTAGIAAAALLAYQALKHHDDYPILSFLAFAGSAIGGPVLGMKVVNTLLV